MAAPLEGVRVVEVAGWMAAPGAAALMADMGADVVKVEPPRGDPMRGATRQPRVPEGEPPVDAAFQLDNRGKRSIAVAVNTPQGADLVRRLAAKADVFVAQPAARPPGEVRAGPRHAAGAQPAAGARHPDRLRPGRPGGRAAGLRPDRLLRPRRSSTR